MQMQGSFDATQHKPQYGFDKVMPGRHPFRITKTEITPTKDNSGGMFVVSFSTPQGIIQDRYNLWNSSPKAVEIAFQQLSALCHCTGIIRLDWTNEGAALLNGEGQIEVGFQSGQEPSPERPNGGYTEIMKIFDKNGNEPGKQNNTPQQPQMQPQSAPLQPNANGGWGASQPAQPNTGWGNSQQAAPNPQQNAPQGWQQNQPPQGNQGAAPPWAK